MSETTATDGRSTMRTPFIALLVAACVNTSAIGQPRADIPVPRKIGNRANGFSYQPTPGEVLPRESAAGLRPSVARQNAINQELSTLDRRLLLDEGLSAANVPRFAPR